MKRLFLIFLILLVPHLCFAQTGPCATVIGPKLPNLVSEAQVSKQSSFISVETFSSTDCSVVESGGALTPGTHTLLRFDSQIDNVGQADLFLGYPPNCPSLYYFDNCHGHYHITFATVYRLWTETGFANWQANRDLSRPMSDPYNQQLLDSAEAVGSLIRSHKQGFCFKDTVRLGGTPEYTRNEFGVRVLTKHFDSCYDDQGLTVGYGDKYGALLDGQFFVVDTVAPGWYIIEIQANPEHVLPESGYLDNISSSRVRL